MREILFRGKRKDNGAWAYGCYLDSFKSSNESHRHWIIQSAGHNGGALLVYERVEIVRETLGQFTGLLDKNGNKIFEGDILHYNTGFAGEPKERNGSVIFRDGGFTVHNASMQLSWYIYYGCEIIGNVHEVKE